VEHFRQKQPLSNDRAGGFPAKDAPPPLRRTAATKDTPKKDEAPSDKQAVRTA
jgi:hypothetical protein